MINYPLLDELKYGLDSNVFVVFHGAGACGIPLGGVATKATGRLQLLFLTVEIEKMSVEWLFSCSSVYSWMVKSKYVESYVRYLNRIVTSWMTRGFHKSLGVTSTSMEVFGKKNQQDDDFEMSLGYHLWRASLKHSTGLKIFSAGIMGIDWGIGIIHPFSEVRLV